MQNSSAIKSGIFIAAQMSKEIQTFFLFFLGGGGGGHESAGEGVAEPHRG